ncbi:MAG: prepilin-type N-terminal cleavage/methylation domain-containing protein [Patescibacteria group bacterium]|nr:prepilin-type N-terminal cleavage/methylation domain-containing protein [Patescibacteria group bacterium]
MALKLQIKKYDGFSLMELMVTITILILMSTAFMVLFSNGYKTYRYNREMIGSAEQAAIGIRAFEKTARGATNITEAANNLLTFLAYQKGDNYPAPSKISFYLTGASFYKSVIPPTPSGSTYIYQDADKVVTLITDHVSSQNMFSYYNEAGTLLSMPPAKEAIKMINFSITIDLDPAQAPNGVNQSTKVELRNLKTNL